jgi:hypothetical protein
MSLLTRAVLTVMVLALLAGPSNLSACDGSSCVSCGAGTGHFVGEGVGTDFSTNYCKKGSCPYCGGDDLVRSDARSSESLANQGSLLSGASLVAFLEEHRERLVVNRVKGLVIVSGGCGSALQAAFFVAPRDVTAVYGLRLATLEEYTLARNRLAGSEEESTPAGP